MVFYALDALVTFVRQYPAAGGQPRLQYRPKVRCGSRFDEAGCWPCFRRLATAMAADHPPGSGHGSAGAPGREFSDCNAVRAGKDNRHDGLFPGCEGVLMDKAIVLAVAASFCTATASVAQRQGARSIQTTGRFDVGLIFRLARGPVWLLGIASIIGGFLFQLTALRFGTLAMVQPILALELLLVFGCMALAGRRQVKIKRRDWLAAAAMWAGIAGFLRLASPSGGQLMRRAPRGCWPAWSRLVSCFLPWPRPSGWVTAPVRPPRRAALLGSATGIAWGFVAAVIKELSSRLGGGIGAIFSTWSLYLLLAAGAATMLLASHALAAGPLAASQPGSPSSTR